MATKAEKAVKRAFLRGKNQGKVREEKHALGLLTAIIIILLFLLFAQHFGWWPYSRPKLGTAFYTNISATTTPPKIPTASGSSGSGSSHSGTHSTPGTGSAGTSGSGGGSSSGSGSSGSSPIASFAAGVNVGNTEAQTSVQANGLSQNCSIVAKASASDSGLGQQQVCVYTQGNKIVTVTYLNGRVISASKSGF
jgi:hypothetical protein